MMRTYLENEFYEIEFPQIKFSVSTAVAEMIHWTGTKLSW